MHVPRAPGVSCSDQNYKPLGSCRFLRTSLPSFPRLNFHGDSSQSMVEIISSRLVPECKRRARRRSSIDSMVKALPDFIASSNGTGCDAAICSDATASTMRFFAPIIAGVGLIRRAHLQFKIAYSPVAFDLTERKISLSKIGCHSTDRAVTFDFLDSCFFFFFSFFFLYPAPWLLSRKRTREPERPATTICERSKRRFRFSLLRSIPRRANDVRNDEYDCLVASARFQYFPIRKFSYEKRSFDSKEPGQAERVSIQISPLSLLSLPFSNIARDTTS